MAMGEKETIENMRSSGYMVEAEQKTASSRLSCGDNNVKKVVNENKKRKNTDESHIKPSTRDDSFTGVVVMQGGSHTEMVVRKEMLEQILNEPFKSEYKTENIELLPPPKIKAEAEPKLEPEECDYEMDSVEDYSDTISDSKGINNTKPAIEPQSLLNCCHYCGMEDVVLTSHLNTCSVAPSPSYPLLPEFPNKLKIKVPLDYLCVTPTITVREKGPERFSGCNICDPEEYDNQGSDKHCSYYHTVSTSDVVPCQNCWEWFETEDEMNHHMSFHGKDPKCLYCNLCSVKFTVQHQHGNKISNKMKGPDGIGFRVGQQCMNEHLRTHDTEYKCDQCGKLCASPVLLKSHIKLSHEPKLNVCSICGKCFSSPSLLKYHVDETHDNKQDFPCNYCERKCPTQRMLKKHMESHSPKTFVCELCAKAFVTRGKLNVHFKQVHTDERPHKCKFEGCNESFIMGFKLTMHERVHTGERPFQCDTCEASFKRSDTLKKHIMIHTGEKPYICPHCGEGFIQNSNMKIHADRCIK